MSTVSAIPNSAAIPSGAGSADALAAVRRLLAAVRRRALWWIWVESLAWLAIATAAAFWITLAADWAVEPPGWVRAAALTGAAAGLIAILIQKLFRRLATPLPDAALAFLVERAHPHFRDSLSTAIDLAAGDRTPDDHTVAAAVDAGLVALTTAEAARLVPSVRIGPLFRSQQLGLLAATAAAVVASVGWLAAAQPDVPRLWARRMFMLADEPWPRRVHLVAEGFHEGVRTVARGADVELVVQATTSSGKPPDLVDVRSRTEGDWRTERMGTRGTIDVTTTETTAPGRQTFGHLLRGVNTDTDLEIRGGDARLEGLLLRVVDPPTLAGIEIDYDLPDYLGGGRRRAATARIVRIPQGARVHVACTASKPLAAAVLAIRRGDEPEEVGRLTETGGRAVTATLEALETDIALVLRLTDTEGIEAREPIEFVLSVVPDESPRVALRPAGISTAVTPRGRVPLVGSISDDHGLAAALVRIVTGTAPDTGVTSTAAEPAAGAELADATGTSIVRGGETLLELDERPAVIPLEPLRLAVGSRLELSVEARDACGLVGGPNRGGSDTWTLEVVSAESLRALLEAREVLLRRRFESVIADLAQARDQLREPAAAGTAAGGGTTPAESRQLTIGRCGEAAARAAGETGEIAAAFRGIRDELDNNSLSSPEVEQRLVADIAVPLADLAALDLPALSRACGTADTTADPLPLVTQADEAVARMRAVLERMLELESYNEVLERLRGVIRLQEEIRAETVKEHKKRARAALEGP